jgi:hypothetical protein
VPQVVVAEVFSYIGCEFCPSALQNIEKLSVDLSPSLIILEYHTLDSYGTAETNDLFYDYHLIGTPSVVFNGATGTQVMMGPESYDTYKARVDALIGQKSIAMITASVNSAGKISATVSLANLSPQPIENATLYAVVYEDLKKSEHHFIVRDIIPAQNVKLDGNSTAQYEFTSGITKSSAVHLVIILKSASGHFIQAQYVK